MPTREHDEIPELDDEPRRDEQDVAHDEGMDDEEWEQEDDLDERRSQR